MDTKPYNNKKPLLLALLNILIFNSIQTNEIKKMSPANQKQEPIKSNLVDEISTKKQEEKSVNFLIRFTSNAKKAVSDNFNSFISNMRRRLWDNFHTIEKERCYRSRQLSSNRLKKYVEQYNIKTIINLRGMKEDKTWWNEEQGTAKKLSVNIVDVKLSADELPSKKDILDILEVFDCSPQPILIHCRRGADRTGMIAALWVLDKMGKNKKYAKSQLSLWYGHYKYFTPNMLKFIDMWEGRNWLLHSYNNLKNS